MENIDITGLLSDSEDGQLPPLRISTDSERDTSHSTTDTSRESTADTTAVLESRVNTAPRRALPKVSDSPSPEQPKKSRRQLFTHKEGEMDGNESDETTLPPNRPLVHKPTPPPTKRKQLTQPKQRATQPTQRATQPKQQATQPKQPTINCSRKQLARAERIAKKILTGCTQSTLNNTRRNNRVRPRIVLTGMSRTERQSCIEIVKSLNGKLQNSVDKLTTHVVLGSCGMDQNRSSPQPKPRTMKALLGAVRGCYLVNTAWLEHCKNEDRWTSHVGFEIAHLRKLSQKARVERSALRKTRCEYAYDVFRGMRIRLCHSSADTADLLALCGATVYWDTDNLDEIQNGGCTQNGRHTQRIQKYLNQEYDIKIGNDVGDINAKWIFDSVAATRMRTARRYVVKECSLLATQMAEMMC